MRKVRRIRLKAFRGTSQEVKIDFEPSLKNMAVFGENASGKSTLTDAFEWFLTSQIKHLWAEDCKSDAINNVHSRGGSEVEIVFSAPSIESIKTLSPSLKSGHTNASSDFCSFLNEASKDRIFLRHTDIANFIVSTKSKKRDEIERIIGFEDLRKFSDTLKMTINRLSNNADFLNYQNQKQQSAADFKALTHAELESKEQVTSTITTLFAQHNVVVPEITKDSYRVALTQLEKQIGGHERVKTIENLEKFNGELLVVEVLLANASEAKTHFDVIFSKLLQDKTAVEKILLESFLSAGLDILDSKNIDSTQCPFCLSPSNFEDLRASLHTRIHQIASFRTLYAQAKSAKEAVITSLEEIEHVLGKLKSIHESMPSKLSLPASFAQLMSDLNNARTQIGNSYEKLTKLDDGPTNVLLGIRKMVSDVPPLIERQIQKLSLSSSEQSVLETYVTIKQITAAFVKHERAERQAEIFVSQVKSLTYIYEKFILAQNDALQSILNAISACVGQYFRILHPHAPIDEVKLRLLGEQGIEFEYCFHGKSTYPPRKFLSESYLNSLVARPQLI